jgi:hypothetical protein
VAVCGRYKAEYGYASRDAESTVGPEGNDLSEQRQNACDHKEGPGLFRGKFIVESEKSSENAPMGSFRGFQYCINIFP